MASAFGSDSVSGFEKDPKLEDEEKKGSDNEEMKESENEEKKEGKRKLEDEDKKGSDDEEMKGSENEEKKKGKRKLEDEEKKGSDDEEMKGSENEEKKKGKRMSEDDWEQEKTAWEEMLVEEKLKAQEEEKEEAEHQKELQRQERERILRLNERTIKRYRAVVPAKEWEDTVKTVRKRAEKDKKEWAGKEERIEELRKAMDSGLPFTAKQFLEICDLEKRRKELLKSEMDIMMVACSALGPIYEGDAANIKIDDEEKELERQKRERTLRRNERTVKQFKAATPAEEWERAVTKMRERAQEQKEEWAEKEWRIQQLKQAFYSGHQLFTAEHLADIRDWQKKQKEFLRSEEEQEMDIMMNACSALGAKYKGYNNDIADIYISSDDD